MRKTYLDEVPEAEEGDIIRFEMPSFCSGEYLAMVYSGERGTYIYKNHDYFEGCRDYSIIKKTDTHYETFKALL